MPHKTELGVVRLNLTTPQEVRQAFADIVALASQAVGADGIDGVVIQPMISGGVETIVGIAHDPVFGPLVAFGIGGINVEAFGDVRFRVAPLTDRDADDLLHEIRGVAAAQGASRAPAGRHGRAARRPAARVTSRRGGAGDRRARSESGHRAAAGPRVPHRGRADQGRWSTTVRLSLTDGWGSRFIPQDWLRRAGERPQPAWHVRTARFAGVCSGDSCLFGIF